MTEINRSTNPVDKKTLPFHFCLFFLLLDHLNLTVLPLRITIANCAGMLDTERRRGSHEAHFKEHWWCLRPGHTLQLKLKCVCRHLRLCVCSHILRERLQRLPSADPLTGGAVSQRPAIQRAERRHAVQRR